MAVMRTFLFVGLCILIFGAISTTLLASVAPPDAWTQAAFTMIGLICFGCTQFVQKKLYKSLSIPFYLVLCLFLVLTLFIGHTSKGSVRWLAIGPIKVQLSEPAKPLLALALATYVMQFPLINQKRLIGLLLLASLSIVPVFIQPDLGSALVLTSITAAITVVCIKKISMLIPWGIVFCFGVLFAWNYMLYDYQKQRIFSFLSSDTQTASSYNARQAQIAVGSGKLWGRGLGHGVQSSLKFLPEHHTDFFFASYAEELGFVGVTGLLLLYGIFFGALFYPIEQLPLFSRIYRYAVITGLLFQAGVHIAMNIGLSPVTGIPLPLLSSGGSSFVSICIAIGIAIKLQASSTTSTFGIQR